MNTKIKYFIFFILLSLCSCSTPEERIKSIPFGPNEVLVYRDQPYQTNRTELIITHDTLINAFYANKVYDDGSLYYRHLIPNPCNL